MQIYNYKARTQQNETVTGKVEANTASEANLVLRERGLFVISIVEFHESSLLAVLKYSKVSKNDIVNFTRQLSTMVTAGLPLTEAVQILEVQAKPVLKKLLSAVRRDVEGGMTLAKALEKHPTAFSTVYISLIKAGESAGVLDQVLHRLADTLEKQKEFSSKTKGALIYPAIVMLAMVIVGFVMMIFVIPKMTEMYKDFGADLPMPTMVLITISDFMVAYWYLLLIVIGGGAVAFNAYRKTPAGKLKVDEWLLKLPIFGELRAKIALVELTRTLSLLISAGISLLTAIEISFDSVGNMVFRNALVKIAKDVEKGQSLSSSVAKRVEFPVLMSQMISVGEETGKLDEVLLKLSAYFETESEHAVKGLTTAMEPLIMIVLGIGVGLLIIAIILPIYNLTSQF
ncbi:type II secretion system F family protein [Candidatus Woesebacteria bacterium]|nr:type II secretion system F family protein [Candidatus Woesebacteria bacterium]